MSAPTDLGQWLAGASVDPAVHELRPDYAALLVTAEGLRGGPGDATSEAVLAAAETTARAALAGRARRSWRTWSSGGRPTAPSAPSPSAPGPASEALLRRLDGGQLPRIDRITDVYNAVSDRPPAAAGRGGPGCLPRSGPAGPRVGEEVFGTTAGGAPVDEHPEPGEVVWRDDAGVTCRRWNWRQGARTRITADTTRAVFVLDGLGALGRHGLQEAADALVGHLGDAHPGVRTQQRLLTGAP